MSKFRFVVFLVSSLLLTVVLASVFIEVQAQQQDQYSLQLQGFAWNRTTINTLIVTSDNETWWNPSFVNSTLRAINQWNTAIAYFSSNYSDYAYLSDVKMEPLVSNETKNGFDMYVTWTKSPLSNTSDEVGLSKTLTDPYSSIINCTINLAAETNHGYSLTDSDVQNVALHELGHGLGLGHSNYTGDLMYPMYTLRGSNEAVSTLDVYGVATVFKWILNPSEFRPVNKWLDRYSLTLPLGVGYQYAPVSPQDSPPQTILNNPVIQVIILMVQILLHPQILFIVIVVTLVFVIIGLIPGRRRKND